MGGRCSQAEAFTLNSSETSSNDSLIPTYSARFHLFSPTGSGSSSQGGECLGSCLETNRFQTPPAGKSGKGVNGHWTATTGEESANYIASQLLMALQGTSRSLPGTRNASVTPAGIPLGGLLSKYYLLSSRRRKKALPSTLKVKNPTSACQR